MTTTETAAALAAFNTAPVDGLDLPPLPSLGVLAALEVLPDAPANVDLVAAIRALYAAVAEQRVAFGALLRRHEELAQRLRGPQP